MQLGHEYVDPSNDTFARNVEGVDQAPTVQETTPRLDTADEYQEAADGVLSAGVSASLADSQTSDEVTRTHSGVRQVCRLVTSIICSPAGANVTSLATGL